MYNTNKNIVVHGKNGTRKMGTEKKGTVKRAQVKWAKVKWAHMKNLVNRAQKEKVLFLKHFYLLYLINI